MSKVVVTKSKLDNLANAIAAKSGEELTMTLDEMVSAVDGIETGGGGITPTGNIDITEAGVTDVTEYATATVPSATFYLGHETEYATSNNQRKWKIRAYEDIDVGDGDNAGWLAEGANYGAWNTYSAIAKNTSVTPTESSQTIGGINYMMEGAVTVNAIPSNYVGSGVTQRDSTDLSASGDTVSVPAGHYASSASKAVASGTVTAPSTITGSSATVSTGTNTLTLTKTVSVTPSVTAAGYVSSGTAGNASVSLSAPVTTQGATTYHPSTTSQTINGSRYLTGNQTINAVTLANLTADNIKSGVTVKVGDSSDDDCVASVTGTYSGGGGGTLTVATKTLTNTAVSQTLSFTSLSGQPKYWFLRCTSNVSSSGSTTYYYVTDCFYDGTSVKGNTFRIGSTRRVQNVTSGITQSYSGNTLTITAGSSSGATPGQFYGASGIGYELIYIY